MGTCDPCGGERHGDHHPGAHTEPSRHPCRAQGFTLRYCSSNYYIALMSTGSERFSLRPAAGSCLEAAFNPSAQPWRPQRASATLQSGGAARAAVQTPPQPPTTPRQQQPHPRGARPAAAAHRRRRRQRPRRSSGSCARSEWAIHPLTSQPSRSVCFPLDRHAANIATRGPGSQLLRFSGTTTCTTPICRRRSWPRLLTTTSPTSAPCTISSSPNTARRSSSLPPTVSVQ